MKTYKVRILESALNDLRESVLFFSKDSASEAIKFHDLVIETAHRLGSFPLLGSEVPDKKIRIHGYRLIVIKDYLFFYRIFEKEILVYRVVHGKRNYPLLFNDYQTQSQI